MTTERSCLRCGSATMIPAQLEHPMAFCVDHTAHHGVLHLCLKASLCQDCGHVEFWVPDARQIRGPHEAGEDVVLQEEDF